MSNENGNYFASIRQLFLYVSCLVMSCNTIPVWEDLVWC